MAKQAMLTANPHALARYLMVLLLLSTILAMNMDQVNFAYSLKNIPIPTKQEYHLELISSVGIFIANFRWRCHFPQKPSNPVQKETFDFKTTKADPGVPDLVEFKDRIHNLVKSLKF